MTQKDYIALVNQAQRKSYEYYVLSAPTISDTEFDVLVAEIEKAESEHPEWIVPDSPTQCVGSDLSANGRRQIIHRTPMLSCQKAKNLDELAKWVSKSEQRMNELTQSNPLVQTDIIKKREQISIIVGIFRRKIFSDKLITFFRCDIVLAVKLIKELI